MSELTKVQFWRGKSSEISDSSPSIANGRILFSINYQDTTPTSAGLYLDVNNDSRVPVTDPEMPDVKADVADLLSQLEQKQDVFGTVTESASSVSVSNTKPISINGVNLSESTITGLANLTSSSDSSSAVNKQYVDDAIIAIPNPMTFKGSLGSGGTISTLPAPSTSTIGNVYKAIESGAYDAIPYKAGDLFICDDSPAWVLIPSGDEPSGTVTNIATGTGLIGGPITSTGTISVNLAGGEIGYPASQPDGSYLIYAKLNSNGSLIGEYTAFSDDLVDISGQAIDTNAPTCKAVKDYVDSQIGPTTAKPEDTGSISYADPDSGTTLWTASHVFTGFGRSVCFWANINRQNEMTLNDDHAFSGFSVSHDSLQYAPINTKVVLPCIISSGSSDEVANILVAFDGSNFTLTVKGVSTNMENNWSSILVNGSYMTI